MLTRLSTQLNLLLERLTALEQIMRRAQLSSRWIYRRKEAAQMSVATIDHWIRAGMLDAERRGRAVLVSGESIQRLNEPRCGGVEVLKI